MHLELIVLVLHFCELTFIRLGLEIGFMHTINQTRAWAEINPEETVTVANVFLKKPAVFELGIFADICVSKSCKPETCARRVCDADSSWKWPVAFKKEEQSIHINRNVL